jgi:predicted house-cleaning NTP pyrophosphatase (Maf/HAM1 superfamily)
MLLINIPEPCHENWNEMSPREQGAFCNVCSKTVIDFTSLSDEEVKNYFLANHGQKTCGRFKNTQLSNTIILYLLY